MYLCRYFIIIIYYIIIQYYIILFTVRYVYVDIGVTPSGANCFVNETINTSAFWRNTTSKYKLLFYSRIERFLFCLDFYYIEPTVIYTMSIIYIYIRHVIKTKYGYNTWYEISTSLLKIIKLTTYTYPRIFVMKVCVHAHERAKSIFPESWKKSNISTER